MPAVSAWNVMIRLNSSSTLPAMFRSISEGARKVQADIAGLEKQVATLEQRIEASRAGFGRFRTDLNETSRSVRDLGAGYKASETAARAATAANANLATSSFVASGAAAARAASNVSRYAAALALVTGGGPRGASIVPFGGSLPAIPSGPLPIPSFPVRNVTPIALAAAAGGAGGGVSVSPGGPGFTPYSAPTRFGFPRNGGGSGPLGPGGGGFAGGGIPPLNPSFGGLAIPGFISGAAHRAVMYGAEAALGSTIDAVHEAGKLQTILLSTQNIIGASNAQMDRIRQMSFDVGNKNAMSAVETAEMFREIARMSVGAFGIDGMMQLLPQMAKLQTVLGAARGYSAHQTVDNVMGIIHLLRAYDPKAQMQVSDTVLRMGELMPDDLAKARTQMGYFAPTLKNLHVSNDDAAALMIAISRFGMGRGKGGTSIQNLFADALGGLQLTEHAQKGKDLLLGAGTKGIPGLNVLDARGNSRYFTNTTGDPMGFLMALESFAQKYGSVQAQKTFESAFGKVGSRLADLMADPVMVDQLKKINAVLKESKTLGLNAQADTIYGTAQFQEKRAMQGFQSLMTELGYLTLPGVTKGFKDIGDAEHGAQVWLHQHAALERRVSKAIVDGVVGIERYLVSHKSDWKSFGHSLWDLGSAVSKDGPALRDVVNGFIDLLKAIQPILPVLDDLIKALGMTPSDAASYLMNKGPLDPTIQPKYPTPWYRKPDSAKGGWGGPGDGFGNTDPTPKSKATHATRPGASSFGSWGAGPAKTVRVSVVSNYTAPAGESDAMHRRRAKAYEKALAQRIASIVADTLGLDARSGGVTPQMPGHSIHAQLAGVPS